MGTHDSSFKNPSLHKQGWRRDPLFLSTTASSKRTQPEIDFDSQAQSCGHPTLLVASSTLMLPACTSPCRRPVLCRARRA